MVERIRLVRTFRTTVAIMDGVLARMLEEPQERQMLATTLLPKTLTGMGCQRASGSVKR